MSSDVRFAVVSGRGYGTLRARASYESWGRCVPPSEITYYSEEAVGGRIPTESVRILRDPDAMPYHLLPVRKYECGDDGGAASASDWLMLVGTDSYVNLRNLDAAIADLTAKGHGPDGPPVLVGDAVRYYPGINQHPPQEYVSLAGGVLMNRATVERALCAPDRDFRREVLPDGRERLTPMWAAEEVSNFAAYLAKCLGRKAGRKMELIGDGRFNVHPVAPPAADADADVHADAPHGAGRGVAPNRLDDFVSVGYLDPPAMLTLGGAHLNRTLYDEVLDSGHYEDLTADDIFVMTITGARVKWRALTLRDTWFRWAKHARFFSEAYDPDLNTVELVGANEGHKNSKDVRLILEWVYDNEVYLPNTTELKYRWFLMTDDDTYVRFPRLVEFLRHYDSREPTYMGRCQGVPGRWDTVLGGPGIVLSAAAMERLRSSFLRKCELGNYGDMWIGKCTSRAGLACTDESIFYDRAPAELPDDRARVDHTVSFHMSAKEMAQLYKADISLQNNASLDDFFSSTQ